MIESCDFGIGRMSDGRVTEQVVVKYWLPLTLWVIAMAAATSIPGDLIPAVPVPGLDKVVHALLYGGLAFLLQRWLRGGLRRPPARPLLMAGIACGIYAVLDELHQLAIPKRMFSAGDLAADGAGIAVGLIIAAVVIERRRGEADVNTKTRSTQREMESR